MATNVTFYALIRPELDACANRRLQPLPLDPVPPVSLSKQYFRSCDMGTRPH